MGILATLFNNGISSTVDSVGNAIDKIFTSDEERLSKQVIIERLNQQLLLGQIELNKSESIHRSIFVAGWRPFIGWTCGLGIFYEFLLNPLLASFGIKTILISNSSLHSLVIALLGLGSLRTFEKINNKAK